MLEQPLSNRLREIRETHAPPAAEPTPVHELPRRLLLGQLLVEKGLLSGSDLGLALAHQRSDGRPLGQILISMGIVTEQELARTLTEQHGFDFSMSLRRRLSPGADRQPEADPDEILGEGPEPERYVVREPAVGEPLHVSDTFLDAADAAFELIEERNPAELEVVRIRDGETEHLWAYKRDDAETAPAA